MVKLLLLKTDLSLKNADTRATFPLSLILRRDEKIMLFKQKLIFSLLMLTMVFATNTRAEVDKGLEIAQEMKAREKGFVNYTASMEMVLINTSGKKKTRKLRILTRETDGDGDQTLAVFDSPADVKGTGFLSHTHIKQNDMQWLYLPSLKRVKRIAPRNKAAPFMGSEFSYEDLASFEVERYRYKYIKDEKLEGIDCYVLERIPGDKYSGYSQQRIWVEKARYLLLKIDFYNKKNIKLKTLRSDNFKQYLNQFWFAHTMRMKNHQSGKTSVLLWSDFKFRKPLRAADFNPNSLKRLY